MSAAKTNSYFGRAMKRVEDPRLIKGIATYVDDMKMPGLLHAAILCAVLIRTQRSTASRPRPPRHCRASSRF